MKDNFFSQDSAHTFVHEKCDDLDQALAQTTHLGIGAHQDDLEVMAAHGIMNCIKEDRFWFSGVTCTDGAGSARSGEYSGLSNEDMAQKRCEEQVESAKMGEYSAMLQLSYPSSEIKKAINPKLVSDLKNIIEKAKPAFIYTHNLADKHDTHIAVTMATIMALRESNHQPEYLYGCEVWRTLDWLGDHRKVPMEIKGNVSLVQKLIECHKTQIAGGKRYDLAAIGRMKSNATFFESHTVDQAENLWFAMDLKPLITNKELSPSEFVNKFIDEFKADVNEKINRFI